MDPYKADSYGERIADIYDEVKLRYAWPPELDLMARLAGLRLRERWGSWARATFTADSGKHISVYGSAGGI